MVRELIIKGYSVGDRSVGIGTIDFEINTGINKKDISNDDKKFLKRLIREIWELHDNGDIIYFFSDENDEFGHKFNYENSKKILK